MSFCYYKGFSVHIRNIQPVDTTHKTSKRVQRVCLGKVADEYSGNLAVYLFLVICKGTNARVVIVVAFVCS